MAVSSQSAAYLSLLLGEDHPRRRWAELDSTYGHRSAGARTGGDRVRTRRPAHPRQRHDAGPPRSAVARARCERERQDVSPAHRRDVRTPVVGHRQSARRSTGPHRRAPASTPNRIRLGSARDTVSPGADSRRRGGDGEVRRTRTMVAPVQRRRSGPGAGLPDPDGRRSARGTVPSAPCRPASSSGCSSHGRS